MNPIIEHYKRLVQRTSSSEVAEYIYDLDRKISRLQQSRSEISEELYRLRKQQQQ